MNNWMKFRSHFFGAATLFLITAFLMNTAPVGAAEKPPEPEAGRENKILQFFDTVNLSGVGDLYIEQAEDQSLTVEAEKSILPDVKVFVKERTLYIDLNNASSHTEEKINYYLKVKTLNTILSFSSSTVFIKKGFENETLNIGINGFGLMDLKLYVDNLNIKIEGGGKVIGYGTAKVQNLLINGAGEFIGNALHGKQAIVEINGSGIANVHANDSLTAKISKEGILKYCGQPKIEKNLSKGAIVEPLKESECRL